MTRERPFAAGAPTFPLSEVSLAPFAVAATNRENRA